MANFDAATKRLWRPFLTLGGDLEIHRLGFGAMRVVGNPRIYGQPEDRAGALEVLRRAVRGGTQLIDTADAYGPATSEELIAEALHPYPERLVIATKGGIERPTPEQWKPNGRPEHLRSACEASLRRLRVERIDLYQLHAVDPQVPVEDSMGTLFDLQREGKIRHVGVSNFSVEELDRTRQLGNIVSVQNRYSISLRRDEEVVRYCERHQIAYLPWGPLSEGRAASSDALAKVAKLHGATPTQVALSWLLSHSPNIVPIPGTSKLAHLEENLGARELVLTTEDMQALDAAV